MSFLEGMSANELHDYAAYYALEPWGCRADDVRTAIVAQTVAACLSTSKTEFSDFLPQWEPPRRLSYAEGAKAFAALFGA